MILRVPTGCPGCSVDGKWYPAKKGIIKVPDDVGPLLFAHGCIEISPKDPTPEEIEAAKQALIDAEILANQEAEEEAARLLAEEAAQAELNPVVTEAPKGE